MEYKVLIKLFVPEIEETYELYIPINKTIGELSVLLTQAVNSIPGVYPIKPGGEMCHRRTSQRNRHQKWLRISLNFINITKPLTILVNCAIIQIVLIIFQPNSWKAH